VSEPTQYTHEAVVQMYADGYDGGPWVKAKDHVEALRQAEQRGRDSVLGSFAASWSPEIVAKIQRSAMGRVRRL
jgi:hypothetical protein